MTLSAEEKRDLAAYRLSKATALLADAEMLLAAGSYASSANRSYYAVLTAARAALALRGTEAQTHEGVKVMLSRDFIKPGILPRECGETFRSLQARRMDSDYADYVDIGEAEARDSLSRAKAFTADVERVVRGPAG